MKNYFARGFMAFKDRFRSFKSPLESSHHPSEEHDRHLVFSLARSRIPSLRQLMYVWSFLSVKEKKAMKLFGGISSLALLVFIGSFFVKGTGIPAAGGEYTEAVVGFPQALNPILAGVNSSEAGISSLVYRKLFMWDEWGALVPDLVEWFEVKDQGKTYVLHLRKDVVWSDQELFDADDVLYTFSVIQDPAYRSPLLPRFLGVTLEKRGDFDVSFILSEPYSDFPAALTAGILPQHLWANTLPQSFPLSALNQKPIGNGPFQFESLGKDQDGLIHFLSLKRNPLYQGTPPFLERVTFKFYSDYESAENAFIKMNVDGIAGIPKNRRPIFAQDKNIRLFDLEIPEYVALYFNGKGKEALRSRDVRKALENAVDRTKLITEVLNGSGYQIFSPLLKGFPGYRERGQGENNAVPAPGEMLDKAGWRFDGAVRKKDSNELRLVISTPNSQELVSVAEYLKKIWSPLGVSIELQIIESEGGLKELIREKQYDALLARVAVGLQGNLFSVFHSSQIARGLNLSAYASREVDILLQNLRAAQGEEERGKKYQQLETILMTDAPAVFLYSPSYTYAQRMRVKGFRGTRISGTEGRFASIRSWYVKTKRF